MWFAAAAGAGSAVYKVAFKRVLGEGLTNCQVAITFSVIAFCGVLLLWPIILLLHFTSLGKYNSIDFEATNIPGRVADLIERPLLML